MTVTGDRRQLAQVIWQAGVEAVRPARCLPVAFARLPVVAPQAFPLTRFERILVVGGGKAGAAMSRVLEAVLGREGVDLRRVVGLVNVPDEAVVPLEAIRLQPARPAGSNQPTEAGVAATTAILDLVRRAGPDDLLLCLISGGGSALLPAPVPGVSLADKQRVTALLHRCGATIGEMNAVRKHLSLIKGGGLVREFPGRGIVSLIVSDVIGDPLDVIASGPTSVDPTTFADALKVIERYELIKEVPPAVLDYLRRGQVGQAPETLKDWPRSGEGPWVVNEVIANCARALEAAARQAEALGYGVWNLGPFLAGETRPAAEVLADIARGQRGQGPLAILSGGETTVTLPQEHGQGGRNQEFTLAFAQHLGPALMAGITVLCAGTDGEDGPTDAAGAVADADLLAAARALGLDPAAFLASHDAYHFFEPLGVLVKTGLTDTNVMDLRVILVD
jgi:hydroxypyruvate reductase/glycerate 2-kinase